MCVGGGGGGGGGGRGWRGEVGAAFGLQFLLLCSCIHFQETNSAFSIFASLLARGQGKNFFSRSKFFTLREDPLLYAICCPGSQQ